MPRLTYACGHQRTINGKSDKASSDICKFCKMANGRKKAREHRRQINNAGLPEMDKGLRQSTAEHIRKKVHDDIISLLSAVTRPGWWVYRADKTPIQILRDLQREKHPHLYQIVDDILEDVEE